LRPGFLRDRSQRLERSRLLLDLEGRAVAPARQGVERLFPDEAVQTRAPLGDGVGVRLLAAQQVLRGREVVEAQPAEQVCVLRLVLAQVVLEVRAAAEPAIDLHVPELLLDPPAAAQPEADDGEDQADRRDEHADPQGHGAQAQDPGQVETEGGGRDHHAGQHERDRPP
jgi:hypothetical protein